MTRAGIGPHDVAVQADGGVQLRGSVYIAPQPRARVLVVHGMGEHSGRYSELAVSLAARGFSTLAYDQRGHGRSDGRRGDARSFEQLAEDLALLRTEADRLLDGHQPLFMFGQSMGGLLTLFYLGSRAPGVAAAVISAPWLETLKRPGPLLRSVGRVLERVAPRAQLRTGLRAEVLTRDPERAAAYTADPLVHDRMTPRLYFSVERAQREVLSRREGFGVPILVLVPDADGLVNPEPTIRLARRLASHDVELEVLPGVRHEPLQDLGRDRVVKRVGDWLESALELSESE